MEHGTVYPCGCFVRCVDHDDYSVTDAGTCLSHLYDLQVQMFLRGLAQRIVELARDGDKLVDVRSLSEEGGGE